MYKNERQEQITKILKSKKSASVAELATAMFVSEATVRRDLRELEHTGAIGRSHGGAYLISGNIADNPAAIREKQNIHQKRQIAELARDFIGTDTTLFIDSSSSAGQVLSLLHNVQGITVITNGIRNCTKAIRNNNMRVLLCGGEATGSSDAVIGHDTIKFLENYRADLCIISCGGISAEGATEGSPYQAEVKRTMLKNSKKRLLLCDSSKLKKTCLCKIADFSDFDYLITDSEIPIDLKEIILQSGCEILS